MAKYIEWRTGKTVTWKDGATEGKLVETYQRGDTFPPLSKHAQERSIDTWKDKAKSFNELGEEGYQTTDDEV